MKGILPTLAIAVILLPLSEPAWAKAENYEPRDRPEKPADKPSKPADKPEKPVEKPSKPGEKPGSLAERTVQGIKQFEKNNTRSFGPGSQGVGGKVNGVFIGVYGEKVGGGFAGNSNQKAQSGAGGGIGISIDFGGRKSRGRQTNRTPERRESPASIRGNGWTVGGSQSGASNQRGVGGLFGARGFFRSVARQASTTPSRRNDSGSSASSTRERPNR